MSDLKVHFVFQILQKGFLPLVLDEFFLFGCLEYFEPIDGTDQKGFVQTDFMFTLKPDYQRGAKRGGTPEYGGALRTAKAENSPN